MAITLTVSGGDTISGIPYSQGMNAQQALEGGYNTFVNPPNIPTISFWVEYFGSYQGQYLGYFVTMLDGTSQQGQNFWMLYVNGALSDSGLDGTILADGDLVEFRYEAYSEAQHGNSAVRALNNLFISRN